MDLKVAWDPGMNILNKANRVEQRSQQPASTSQVELYKASEQLESLFLQQLLKAMRETVETSDLFGSRQAEKVFESMLDQELSDEMSKAGGIGLSRIIYDHMVKHVPDDD